MTAAICTAMMSKNGTLPDGLAHDLPHRQVFPSMATKITAVIIMCYMTDIQTIGDIQLVI